LCCHSPPLCYAAIGISNLIAVVAAPVAAAIVHLKLVVCCCVAITDIADCRLVASPSNTTARPLVPTAAAMHANLDPPISNCGIFQLIVVLLPSPSSPFNLVVAVDVIATIN